MLILFFISGIGSGLLAGLLGIGGGVITVPILYFIFNYVGIGDGRVMQVAVSTSLAASFVTSAVASFVQFRKKMILFSVLKLLVPGLFFGCIAGSMLAHDLSSNLLREIFAILAIFLGAYFFFPRLPTPYIAAKPNRTLSFFGLFIGLLSSLLGIGGGSLAFPILLGYQVAPKQTAATSSAATLITTLVGSLTFLIIAWHQPELPNTFGYIEVPAFLAISAGSMLSSPFGVKLSQILHVTRIKQIFGATLVLISIGMFFK
jgi:hypothetical protein